MVRARIEDACRRAGRPIESVTLVAVSKRMPVADVEAAWECGIRVFGENRVQEAEEKIREFRPPGIAWHLVGHLQSNKAGRAVGLFDLIHGVDDLELVSALARRAEARGGKQALLLQVNTSGEASKSGCTPAGALALARAVVAAPALELRGLMTIAPIPDAVGLGAAGPGAIGPGAVFSDAAPLVEPPGARAAFRRLAELRDALERELGVALPELSMGMTGDLEVAIEEGATLVRVGTALFGTRS